MLCYPSVSVCLSMSVGARVGLCGRLTVVCLLKRGFVVNDSGEYILSFIDNTIIQYICTRVHNVKHSIAKS